MFKWIIAILGLFFGNIWGAITGFLIGAAIDEAVPGTNSSSRKRSGGINRYDFYTSLCVLIAEVMKADGKVTKVELEYVKRFFLQNLGPEKTRQCLLLLREILKRKMDIREVCYNISQQLNYPSRMQLMHFLFGLSNANGYVDATHLRVLAAIATNLGISSADFNSLKSMFGSSVEDAYQVLEISSSVSDEEVKKAYRQMAMRHHPDRVAHLGEDIQKSANEKFKKISEAFDRIKKERQMA